MKKKNSSFISSIITLCLGLALTSQPVLSEDIEIYDSVNSNSPPVNVMFIFDLSSSMRSTPDGNTNPGAGELSRREILLEALTNVLENNKEKENLRVGFTWFNSSAKGVSYPATSISADLHDLDVDVPENMYHVYSQIPKELEEIYVHPTGYKTNIVGSLYLTTRYFRGESVWWSARPPKWNGGTYDQDSYTSPLSYTPDPGPKAWEEFGTKKWKTCTENTSDCKNGYSDSYKLQVTGCSDRPSSTCNSYTCPPAGQEGWCSCDSYSSTTKRICDFEYWDDDWLGAKYNSPIEDSCQASYIVLLSDGKPTQSDYKSNIQSLINESCDSISGLTHGECGPDLVEYLANNDQISTVTGSKVFTYTIGFNVNGVGKDYLEALADKGKGIFYPASDASDLEAAFEQIIDSITGESESFTGLVTSIRASTLSSDNRVFMNMFKPGNNRTWSGNTKGYFIDSDGLKDTNLTDATELVTDEDSGKVTAEKFRDVAQSFWSNSADGNFVELGGVSGTLNEGTRKFYTYIDSDAPLTPAAPVNADLTLVTKTDSAFIPAVFGVNTETEKNDIIDWMQSSKLADPLHAKPVLLSYEDNAGNSQDILYSMTNQGLLHAVNATDPDWNGVSTTATNAHDGGEELFAFVPRELLINQKDHKTNGISVGHLYGLDGALSYSHHDTNNDSIINNSEKAYLYFGMRRGGNQYFALDVSNPLAPKLAWQIDGGVGDFAELGQTWSKMIPTTIKWTASTTKKVIIFGGGYDTTQDNSTAQVEDTIGNAIFIVDAADGTLLWKATKNNSDVKNSDTLKYSIPSDITVIDTNADQLADRLYFGDMGGQIWRIDLINESEEKSFSGYKLATLGGSSEANSRRFYSPPSVARIRTNTEDYFAITIGSGFRSHPLSKTTSNYFFMLKDKKIEPGSPSPKPGDVTIGMLYDITSNIIQMTTDENEKETQLMALQNSDGWKLKLENNSGEKSLSPALIFDSKIAFTTYTPAIDSNASGGECSIGGGTSRFYFLDLKKGIQITDFNYGDSSDSTTTNRFKSVPGMGIPSEPVPYFPEGVGQVNLYVGKHKIGEINNPLHRINWKVVE